QGAGPHGRDDRLDDAEGTCQARADHRQAQDPHRQGLGDHRPGGQQAAQDAPRNVHRHEEDQEDGRLEGHDGDARQGRDGRRHG
nr:hypothetical protein [Tanacetum cinerariifolium]